MTATSNIDTSPQGAELRAQFQALKANTAYLGTGYANSRDMDYFMRAHGKRLADTTAELDRLSWAHQRLGLGFLR